MSKMSVYLILPYLTTSKPVEIRGVRFRNSQDTGGLPIEDVAKMKTLFAMFFLRGNLRIREMAYSILEYDPEEQKSREEVVRKWSEACLLIEYLYTRPNANWRIRASVENASMYLFQDRNVSIAYHNSDEFAENIDEARATPGNGIQSGFSGSLLRRHSTRFTVIKGSRIYPPDHFIDLHIIHRDLSQAVSGISLDKTKWALADLIANPSRPLSPADRRALYAMRWFSDSCKATLFEDQSLLLLAVAFETLLNIDPGNKERVTERLRVTIKAIVGGFPRIDSWVEQFYDARSRVVHEGGLPNSVYYAIDRASLPITGKEKKSPIPHGSLTSYGRTIFHLCIDTLLSGSRMAEEVGLQDSLVHNQERLESICQTLDGKAQTPTERVALAARIARDLRPNCTGFDEFADTKMVLATLRRSIQLYNDEKASQHWVLPADLERLVQAIFDGEHADNNMEHFRRVVALDKELSQLPWYDYGFGVKGDDPAGLVLALVSYAAVVAPSEARWTEHQLLNDPEQGPDPTFVHSGAK
ncbi:MAG TPA: hypothetical protein VGZ22_00995 [Isosphaeraceae bacterium]|jgi:hypothetical protein|nr:hypothetical protein [Isosphaeraceae bacterium]